MLHDHKLHIRRRCKIGDSIPAAVGALVARAKLGAKTSDVAKTEKRVAGEIERIKQKMAKDAEKRPKPSPDTLRYLAGLYIHSATLAMVAGDKGAAAAAVKTARGHWKRMDTVDVSLAKAMGISVK